ncbi:MAG: hypothetical protein WC283_03785 [Candidatus Paceibacterota bacterium]|jgi:hypothetical protein
MDFLEFKAAFQNHVYSMIKDESHLFVVDVDKDLLWSTYLNSFPDGTNVIFRERSEYDCCACRHFLKSYGNIVAIKNGKVVTSWDFSVGDVKYQPVINALSKFIKSHKISNVFVTKELNLGVDKNYEQQEDGSVVTWNHFYLSLPDKFKTEAPFGKTIEYVKGQYRDVCNVFKRSLEEISEDAILTILDLISQKSLYKGDEWEVVLRQFLSLHKEYSKLKTEEAKDVFAWEQSVKVGPVVGKIRNHSIGTLLTDITNGTELDDAVTAFEKMVAPSNYKRPKAIYTKKMLDDAKAKLEADGLMLSLYRRFARIDDISINNVIFANRDAVKRMNDTVFDDMEKSIAVNVHSFDRVDEISIDDFIKSVVPSVSYIDVLFENRHAGNLVSLIAPEKESKNLFSWDNPFSWAYTGNMTDSMKQRVKAAGGNIEGDLRYSIQWNDDGNNNNDFDAHCIEPGGNEIFFSRKKGHCSSGELDVDIIRPNGDVAVENITYSDRRRMPNGTYSFFVHCYSNRGGKSGFSAEIEFDGQTHSFSYNRPLNTGEKVQVAKVEYSSKDGFKLIELLPSSTTSKVVWSMDTNQFQPVSMMMLSPNYWDLQEGRGNKHYFFMLKDSINDESPNGFFNEYLRPEFNSYKRVFEALGSKMHVNDTTDQLSGIGFSSTQRNSLIAKVEGRISRTLKIIF